MPAVGLAVAAVLVVVMVAAISGDDDADEQGGPGATTAAPATVEEICAENRAALAAAAPAIETLTQRVTAATTPEELIALSVEADQVAQQSLGELRELQAQLSAAAVPEAQVEARDALVAALGEVVFSLAAFASRTVEVLATGDAQAVAAYVPEATESIGGLATLEQEVAAAARELSAPSCSAQGSDPAPPTGPAPLTPETVVPQS